MITSEFNPCLLTPAFRWAKARAEVDVQSHNPPRQQGRPRHPIRNRSLSLLVGWPLLADIPSSDGQECPSYKSATLLRLIQIRRHLRNQQRFTGHVALPHRERRRFAGLRTFVVWDGLVQRDRFGRNRNRKHQNLEWFPFVTKAGGLRGDNLVFHLDENS